MDTMNSLKGENLKKDVETLFKKQIFEIDEETFITPDLNGGEFEGSMHRISLFIDCEDINKLCMDLKISPDNLFLAISSFVLSKFVYNKNLIFSNSGIFEGNSFEEYPLILNLNTDLNVKSFLSQINEVWLNSLSHHELLLKIVNEFGFNPKFLYQFNNQNTPKNSYNLILNVMENPNDFELICKFNDALYSPELINTFLNSISIVLNKMVNLLNEDFENTLLKDISILNRDVANVDDLEFIEIEELRVNKIFEKQVELHGNEIILTASDGSYTYNELNEKANRIANALIKRGVGVEDKVMIVLKRDSSVFASIFGILKAGACFIPIDSDYPSDRIEHVLTDSESKFIIVDDIVDTKNIDLSFYSDRLLQFDELLEEENTSNPNVDVSPENLAYIIYTSGSTGLPKGVMIEHRNLANFAYPHQDNFYTYELVKNLEKENYKVLSTTTIAFDVFQQEIMGSLLNAIPVVFADDSEYKNPIEMMDLIKRTGANVYVATPSRLLQYLEIETMHKVMYGFKAYLIAGEAFPPRLYDLLSKNSNGKIYDLYGPTEATVYCNGRLLDSSDINVGKPLLNVYEEVMDEDFNPLPPNVIGELCIAGKGVSRAYLNNPEKNAEAYREINGLRFYRTGDFAKVTEDGEYIIFGRMDNQIKLRGLRIEIGEVESTIKEFEGIKSIVVALKNIKGTDYLCAYYTVYDEFKKQGEDYSIDIGALKEHLNSKLTYYMVPAVYMELDEIPQTANGKTDIRSLPEPVLITENVMPENDTEEKLFDMISQSINIDGFGVTDDLYALGFTSLSLMKFNVDIYESFNVNLDIHELMDSPTIRQIANKIDKGESGDDLDELIKSSGETTFYPLMDNQLGVYYECAQSTEAQYNLPSVVRFDANINPNKLRESIIKTIDEYSYLKTRIVLHHGQLMHKRDDSIAIDEIPIVEINDISDKEIEKENVKRFELLDNQLFRAKIYKTPSETILFFDIHHIISDGESIDLLFNNFAKAYNGEEIQKEGFDGYICSLIEKEAKNSEKYVASEKYFHNQLTKEVDSTILTPDLNGDEEEGKLESISKSIDSQLINKFCADNRISPNILFMASTILTLNKYTFNDKTLLTTIFNGRLNSNYYNTQSFLVKTFPIVSINEDRNITVRQLFNQIDELWKNGVKHSNYPYIKIAEEFDLKPEFMYTYNNLENEKIELDNKVYKIKSLNSLETNYKITFDVNENEKCVELVILYNNGLYSENYIKTFLDSVLSTVNQFINQNIEQLKINEIELDTREEIPTFTPVENPILHKRFEKHANENPDRIALVATDATLTYGQLNQKANIIANALIERNVEPKSNVLVMLSRDSNLIASILGILKAGCAFIPIDPEYPDERINYIYENSQADYIISNRSGENFLDIGELLEGGNAENPNVNVEADDLAYMIYTSGSTGNPKGVMISHENICNQAQNPKSTYDSLLCVTTISFDVSVDDILTSLSNGLKLILADDTQVKNIPELIKLIDENKPEVLEITPSRFASYLEVNEFCNAISCLKCLFLGGEQFSAKVFEDLRKYSDAIVYNSYGPTETTITSNNKEVIDVNDLTVGLPLTNYITDVRDIDGKLVPKGVMGELYIGGTGVGKGYYNMPEKTKEVFLSIDGIPYYRSGDYAIERPNGEIDIKGRIDNQIKLRGLRIEIGEIESNIGKYPNIKQAIVVIKEINNNDHLCAYYTAEEVIDSDDLKEFLKNRLTRYMIPTVFMQLDEIPKTPNGKTDVKNLPEPILITEWVLPKNNVQKKLYEICSEILDFKDFGITDSLFSLGFSSLSLMKLSHEIYSNFNTSLSFKSLMDAENICDLENLLNDADNIEKINFEKQEYYPLSHNQLNVYIESVKNPEKLVYNMVNVIEMGSDINPERLKESLIKVLNHHSYLKSIITQKDGEVLIKRQDDAEVDVDIINKECSKKLQEKFARPFELHDSPLYRAEIYNYDNQTTLLLDVHHIIFDGISFNIFIRNLINAYQGNELLEEEYTGFEYILDGYRQMELDSYKESEEFFNSKIAEIDISTDISPNISKPIENARMGEHINPMSKESIDKYCKEYNITPNNLFLAATLLTLSKYTYTKDMLIATISSGRLNPNYENTLAMIVKSLPLIHKIDTSQSVGEYFESIQNTLTQTINHENYPYTKLFEKYNINPNIYYAYQVGVNEYDQIINDEGKVNSLIINDISLDLPKFNLSIYIEENRDDYLIFLRYNDALYSSEFIAELTDNIELMVKKLQEDITSPIDTISLLPGEKEEELRGIHNSFENIEINTNLKELFEAAVEEFDDEIALIDHGQTLTYKQLNTQANKIANSLVDLGIVPGDHIILKLERSSKLIAAIYAVIKTGASFTIVSTEQPEEQTEFIRQDTNAKIIIQSNIDELLGNENGDNLDVDIKSDDLACIVYTSGSTGKPKGVTITHKGLINYINPRKDNIAIHAIQNDVSNMLSLTTTTFIAFLREALATIINGTKITLTSDEESKNLSKLIRLIKESEVDGLSLTPSRIQEYMKVVEFKDLLNQFKVIIIGGEKFIPSVYDDLTECSRAKIFNSYGSSENTIATHQKLIDSEEITEGTPIPNNIDLIIDIDGNPLPNNITGEICTAGVQTTPGYLNREDLNESEFITVNNLKFYKTGDLAYKNSNDELVIIGRKDKQIKLRGQRIEPGEIESAISKYSGIESVVVTVKQINNQDNLCAYYTSRDEINVEELKEYLSTKLMRYMIPTSFTQLDSMPKTPNGKIDTKNLPLPKISTQRIGPENELEESIFKICAGIVGFDDFGVTDNLYGIGFTSLTIMGLSTEIYNTLGNEINVTSILQKPTIRNIVENIEINEGYADVLDESDENESKYYELTPNQMGIYFDCVKDFEKVNYNLPKYIDFGSGFDENRLKSAIIKVINYHPYLKTRIVMQDGVVYQERRDDFIIDDLIEIVELDGIDDEFKEEFIKPFDLARGPLFRFKIIKIKDNVSLLCDFHHIIVDGTSLNILFRQISSVYDNPDLEFDKNELEPLNGFEYSQKEVNIQKSRHYKESEMFFFNKIKDYDEGSLISPDLTGIEEDGQASEESKVIDKEMVDKFCNESSITPNNLFLSISSFLLSKFVNNRNLLFASITNGRFSPDEQNTLAMMVKTLPVSLKLDSDLSFKEYFEYINKEWVTTLSHSSYPLTEVVNRYGIIPEFVFAFHGDIIEEIEIGGKVVERESLEYDSLQFKLGLNVAEINGKYDLSCQYNDALYSPQLINTFLDSIIIVLNKLIGYGSEELANVFLKDVSIMERDVPSLDDLEFIEIEELRVNKIFEKQVELNGDKVILTASDGQFTFNELNEKANRIANALIKRGVGVEDKVMIVLKRDSSVFASIFGILKAGACFIPIDSDYPSDRIEHVLTDSESKYIIVDDIVDTKNIDLSSYSDRLLQFDELLEEENASNPTVDVSPENLAYIIYTSGSTGLPKGVMIEHRNIANLVYPHPDNFYTYELVRNLKKENYKVLSTTTIAFDVFEQEIMGSILNAIPVVFADDIEYKDPIGMMDLIKRTGANVYVATPSRLLQYLEIEAMQEVMYGFKAYLIAGEAFPPRLYDLLSKNSNGKVYNLYGPTEATVYCNGRLLDSSEINVGKPLLNVYEEVMDEDFNPLPPNVIGELCIAGKGVSRAYLNNPEKNAEAYREINGLRFYRTGDFAKVTDDGEYVIFGRMDNQIKLRGLRIEIGEVESAIKEFEGIESLAVVVKNIKGNDHLCAYFTVYDEFKTDDEGYSIDIDALREHLNSKLTYYMVPTVYMELDEMPQTLNGKTDLRNLPEPVLITQYVAPENDIEAFFADTFADILSIDNVGATDNFFDMGGTSLLVTKITLAALNRKYNISYGDVFANPTPRKLAEFILEDEDSDVSLSEEFDYDYSQINELLKRNTLENFISSEIDDDLGDILLTGATGFLGIHVLRELLENNEGNIYCLIRSRGNLSAEDRLKSLLFYYFSNNYEELFNIRLHVVEGDITSYADFEKLIPYNIDTIFNCAANVKHFSSGTDIEDINFGGVLNGLKFAILKNSKFVQISTYSVAGESINNFPPEDYMFSERDLFIGQGIDNQYLRSKFLAERAVLEAAVENDLSVKIMRVGNLMARSDDGEFQINFISNGFINRLKAFVTIGKIPYSMLSDADELSPIDVTAKSIVELSKTPKECVVFHPYQHHTICFGDILDIIKPLGLKIDAVEEEVYEDYLNHALNDMDKQEGVSGLITSIGSGKFKKIWLDTENEYTVQVLYRLGVKWPIISEEYIYKFIEYLNDLAFFD
ncbi:amino acid adenylation domain-containing protein [Methanobrevibacter sp.]|uniref:amino acid adenylation domain-containing protein n=1 Tax=Methanobrevibacter sp. TaxID=66852 RepID=UPI00386D726C